MKLLIVILPTVLLTIYGQLMTKWRITELMKGHEGPLAAKQRLMLYITDPYILSAFACSFLAAIAWLYVAERYPVSLAFPSYVGVLFIFVLLGSALFLGESITLMHMLGVTLIVAGVFIASRTA